VLRQEKRHVEACTIAAETSGPIVGAPLAAEIDAGLSQRQGVEPGRDRCGEVDGDAGSRLVADHDSRGP